MFTNQRWHSRRDAHCCRHALGQADGRVTSKTSGHQICKSAFLGQVAMFMTPIIIVKKMQPLMVKRAWAWQSVSKMSYQIISRFLAGSRLDCSFVDTIKYTPKKPTTITLQKDESLITCSVCLIFGCQVSLWVFSICRKVKPKSTPKINVRISADLRSAFERTFMMT